MPPCLLQNTTGYVWNIQEGFTDGCRKCNGNIEKLYNPYGVKTTDKSGYIKECSALRQLRCAMGDLTGKLGPLGLEPLSYKPHKTYSFYDENLFLVGPFTSEPESYIRMQTCLAACFTTILLLCLCSLWSLHCGEWHWRSK